MILHAIDYLFLAYEDALQPHYPEDFQEGTKFSDIELLTDPVIVDRQIKDSLEALEEEWPHVKSREPRLWRNREAVRRNFGDGPINIIKAKQALAKLKAEIETNKVSAAEVCMPSTVKLKFKAQTVVAPTAAM